MTTTVTLDRTGPLDANGIAPLPFEFQAISAGEITVTLDGVTVDPNEYTVVLNGDGTGSVVPVDPWDGEVYIISTPSYQQPSNFNRFTPVYPDQMVPPLDRLARSIIALRGSTARSIPQIGIVTTGAPGEAAAITPRSVGGQIVWDITLPAGEVGPGGDLSKSLTRAEMADVNAEASLTRFLAESGREGVFKFDASDLSGAVAADASQGLFVPPATDPTGASGAWVRQIEHSINVRWFGAKGDGVTDDHAAIQAALDFIETLGGGELFCPVVPPQAVTSYKVSSYLSVPPKTRIRGAGRSVTKLVTAAAGGGGANASENARNGSIFFSDQAINGSTRVDIYVEDLGLQCTNALNVGAGYYDKGGTFWSLHRVRFDGFAYGVIMEQSELCDLYECDFENQTEAGLWIVDGPDLSPGAAGDWANRIGVHNSQFNQPATSYCVLDGGGSNHHFEGNNFNGGLNGLLIDGANSVTVSGCNQFESAAGACIAATGAVSIEVNGGTFTQTNGNAAIDYTAGGGRLTVGGGAVFAGGGGARPIVGAGNMFDLWIGSTFNNTGQPLYSGTPTNLHDTTAGRVAPTIEIGEQLLFKDAAGADYQSHEEHASEAGARWHQVVSKGGGGGWAGGYRVKLNFDNGALFTALNVVATGAATAAASLEGPFTAKGVNVNGAAGAFRFLKWQSAGVDTGAFYALSSDNITLSYNSPTAGGSHVFQINSANVAVVLNSGIDLAAGKVLSVAGVRVVSTQGAAITDAAVAAAAPTKAEFDALVGKFNTLLARLRSATGHGLIA